MTRRSKETRSESIADYFGRADVVSEYASFDFLLEPERIVLEELGPALAGARMLDVGVGAGRTALHFAPAVREYVGIDVSPRMIEACRSRFAAASWNASFQVADVRDLEGFDSASFDFVLFSFNGLDTVGGEVDRRAALESIHRVCRSGAAFCFSSSSLRFALVRSSTFANLWSYLRAHPAAALRHPRRLRRVVAESKQWKRLNPSLGELSARGGGLVAEDRYRFEFTQEHYAAPRERIRVEKYHVLPRKQAEQLEEAGFENVRFFGPDGREARRVEDGGHPAWLWIYYLCTKNAEPRLEGT